MSGLYLLDTDCFTLLQRNHPQVAEQASFASRVAISIITVEEALTGWYSRVRMARGSEQLAAAYRGFHVTMGAIAAIEVLPYLQPAIERQIELRHL